MPQWLKASPKCVGLSCIPRTHMFEGEKTLTSCPLAFTPMHTQNRCHKNFKYLLTFIIHVCHPLSLPLIPEKHMLGWWEKGKKANKELHKMQNSSLLDLVSPKAGTSHFDPSICFISVNNHMASSLISPSLSPDSLQYHTSLGTGHQPLWYWPFQHPLSLQPRSSSL